mmetsp:Transcript_26680/g.61541  ORF Transcript_26680/g.61541 Transcript_26680/m.61541 type:complete len:223 (-) Transcript_26680:250-918(-)
MDSLPDSQIPDWVPDLGPGWVPDWVSDSFGGASSAARQASPRVSEKVSSLSTFALPAGMRTSVRRATARREREISALALSPRSAPMPRTSSRTLASNASGGTGSSSPTLSLRSDPPMRTREASSGGHTPPSPSPPSPPLSLNCPGGAPPLTASFKNGGGAVPPSKAVLSLRLSILKRSSACNESMPLTPTAERATPTRPKSEPRSRSHSCSRNGNFTCPGSS